MNEGTIILNEEDFDSMREWLNDLGKETYGWSNHKVLRAVERYYPDGLRGFMGNLD